jgi:hypothetical protein
MCAHRSCSRVISFRLTHTDRRAERLGERDARPRLQSNQCALPRSSATKPTQISSVSASPEEAEDLSNVLGCLLINLGTLTSGQVDAMLVAGAQGRPLL